MGTTTTHDEREGIAAMSATIEGRSEELLRGKNFCHVATLRADGSVHGVPVWVDVEDGRAVLNTAKGRAWPRNLERDPRVTLTVQNMENPYEYLEIRGRAEARRTEGADAHIDSLAKKYMGVDEYPMRQPGEQRVIIRVEPELRQSVGRLSDTGHRAYARRVNRRHSDGPRGWARCQSSRSGSSPRARAASTHALWAWRRRRVSPSGAISMCSLSAGR